MNAVHPANVYAMHIYIPRRCGFSHQFFEMSGTCTIVVPGVESQTPCHSCQTWWCKGHALDVHLPAFLDNLLTFLNGSLVRYEHPSETQLEHCASQSNLTDRDGLEFVQGVTSLLSKVDKSFFSKIQALENIPYNVLQEWSRLYIPNRGVQYSIWSGELLEMPFPRPIGAAEVERAVAPDLKYISVCPPPPSYVVMDGHVMQTAYDALPLAVRLAPTLRYFAWLSPSGTPRFHYQPGDGTQFVTMNERDLIEIKDRYIWKYSKLTSGVVRRTCCHYNTTSCQACSAFLPWRLVSQGRQTNENETLV